MGPRSAAFPLESTELRLKLFTAELFQKCFAYQIESLNLGMVAPGRHLNAFVLI